VYAVQSLLPFSFKATLLFAQIIFCDFKKIMVVILFLLLCIYLLIYQSYSVPRYIYYVMSLTIMVLMMMMMMYLKILEIKM